MSGVDLISILEDLDENQTKTFKWYLKNEKVGNIEPIKQSQLSKAAHEDIVDLMCQKYEFSVAVGVMKSIMTKMNRNDLVTKLSKKLGPTDPPPDESPESDEVRKLMSIRCKFIEKVSEPVLRNLLDKLLEQKVITEGEREAITEKSNRSIRAGDVIDIVRKKGPKASLVLINVLCEEDKYLAPELGLI